MSGARRWRRRRSRRKGWRAWVAPSLAVFLALTLAWLFVEGTTEPVVTAGRKPVERTAALAPLRLPADDAPHGSRMEWWYYNGILKAETGERFAFHVAVFVADAMVKHTVMHLALTDLQTGKRHMRQTRTGGIPAKGGASGFDFQQDGWQVSGAGATHRLRATVDGMAIALDLADVRQPVAHRAAGSDTPGLLDFGTSGVSYYYSRPRMAARGDITAAGGKPVQVTGEVWFDHQWGDFDVLTFGWNWFALHLADGSDVMLYALFDGEGRPVLTAGTVSDAKGAQPLRADQIVLTPGVRWTSPATQVSYPVEWRVQLPAGAFEVKPFFPDGEFDASSTTANSYWEGPVRVTGPLAGQGFMELSGYDRLKSAR